MREEGTSDAKNLPIAKLDEFFAAIAAKETLYLPVDDEGGQAQYQEWKRRALS